MSSAGASTGSSACATHQPTGSFLHSSSLSSSRYSSAPHHAKEALASHNIRLAFGDRVQWVADGLQAIGATGEQSAVSFSSLWTLIQRKQESVTTCVQNDGPLAISSTTTPVKAVEKSAVRAALVILIQHSIVSVRMQNPPKSSANATHKQLVPLYRYHPDKATHLDGCRYARYSEHIKRAIDPTASIVVDTLLLNGRLRTVDLVVKAVEHQQMFHQILDQTVQHHKYTARETTVDAVCKLVKGGYLEQVKAIPQPDIDPDEGEAEFDEPPQKKVKIDAPKEKGQSAEGEDPAVVNVLRGNAQYKSTLPIDAVWRVNQNMFHDSIRALCLGRLVAELYGQKIQSAGSLITGALKFRASLEHSPAGLAYGVGSSDVPFFKPTDVVKFLPKSVMQIIEDKAAKLGEANAIGAITRSFMELAELRHPTIVVRRVGDDLFEIAHASLLDYLRKRIIHQLVEDRHGQVAARILVILSQQGWLESDYLANAAMVPAKDTRAILHELYRSRYVDLFQMSNSQSSKQFYNPGTSIFVWCVHPDRLRQKVIDDVMAASRNLRLRRQHQVEFVGREFIERAQRQTFEEENDSTSDRLRRQRFELGLERIDVALHNLDETLLALADF